MNKQNFNTQKDTIAATPKAANKTNKSIDPKIAGGAIAGAAVLGVGGAAAAANYISDENEEDIIDLDAQAEEIEISPEEGFNPDAPVSSLNLNNIFAGNNPPQTPNAGRTPSAPTSNTGANNANSAQHSNNVNPAHSNTNTVNVNTQQQPASANINQTTTSVDNVVDEIDTPVNPQEVIAITAVDDDDNDMPELLTFESVELLPNEDGTVQIQAQFSMDGESYTMIDVDNDGIFDAVADAAGNSQGSAAGMMLSDIEIINNANNNEYLAANEYDNNSNVSDTGDSAINDTVIV